MSLMLPKPARIESAAYLRFIRNHSCVVMKCWRRTQAHHIVFDGQGRVGSKVSDFQAVPCCEKHHQQYHQIGRPAFEVEYRLDFSQLIIGFLSEYILTLRPEEG